MSPRGFAVERLGIGDWPATGEGEDSKITTEAWRKCKDPESSCMDPVCIVFDVTPDRSWSVIGTAGWRDDELAHVEVVDARKGTGWVADRLAGLVEDHNVIAILYDGRGPAASLVPDLIEAEVEAQPVDGQQQAQACGMFFDVVEQQGVRHLGTADLEQAIRGAATRPLGDAWAWARKTSTANIAPLVACTLAYWGLRTMSEPGLEPLVASIQSRR